MAGVMVNVENFIRAETDRMFAGLQRDAGGINVLHHNRQPASVEHQTVIRMNRDTLYSFAVVDISQGATLTVPDSGDRYVSAMVVNQDHYINRIFHGPGAYELSVQEFDTPYVGLGVRVLVDPGEPSDLAEVAAVQDEFALRSNSARPFVSPEYDTVSLDATRNALLTLAKGLTRFDHAFGAKDSVDPVRHLLGTAAGWGGLPTTETSYIGVEPHLPVRDYELTVREVPVDGFWSVSVYNADGYFEPNSLGAYSVNDLTGVRDPDGSITIRFGADPDGRPNYLPITEGWNYTVRLYQPRAAAIDGAWSSPP